MYQISLCTSMGPSPCTTVYHPRPILTLFLRPFVARSLFVHPCISVCGAQSVHRVRGTKRNRGEQEGHRRRSVWSHRQGRSAKGLFLRAPRELQADLKDLTDDLRPRRLRAHGSGPANQRWDKPTVQGRRGKEYVEKDERMQQISRGGWSMYGLLF